MENLQNAKRTVTVQMTPQIASIDALGNKELNANWDIDPELSIKQDCSSGPKPKSDQDNMHLKSSMKESTSHITILGEQNTSTHCSADHRRPQNSPLNMKTSEKCASSIEDRNKGCDALSNSESLTVLCDKSLTSDPSSVLSNVNKERNGHNTTKAIEKDSKAQSKASALGVAKDITHNSQPNSFKSDTPLQKNLTPNPNNTNKNNPFVNESKDLSLTTSTSIISGTQSEQVHLGSNVNLPETKHISGATDTAAQEKTPHSNHNEKKPPQEQPVKEDSHIIECTTNAHNPTGISQETSSRPLSPSTSCNAADTSSHQMKVINEEVKLEGDVHEEQKLVHCKLYSEASTMTTAVEFANDPRTHYQDVEVQAVATVCSQSTATSPSLLSLQPHPRQVSPLPEESESLAVVVEVDLADRPTGVISQICSTASSVISSSNEQAPQSGTVMVHVSADLQPESKVGTRPNESGVSLHNSQRGFSPLQPVYQINIETCQENKSEESSHQGQIKPAVSSSGPASVMQNPVTTSDQVKPPTSKSTQSEAQSKTNATSSKLPSNITMDTPPTSSSTPQCKKPRASKLKPKKDKEEDEAVMQKNKSVHDVVWDEQGMTWEVYGASVDPESLGFAIQSHLQCKIKEHEKLIVARTALRKSLSSPPGKKKKNRRQVNINVRSMFQNIRRPNCCTRPSVQE